MIKKQSLYQGLDQFEALIQDTSADSPTYFRLKDVPELLTGGKNLIKIRLNNNFLKIGSDIKIEVLDFNGNPIYTEFTKCTGKDGESHVVSFYVYDDTPPGPATIYIVGVAATYPDGRSVEKEYSDSYNIKWSKTLLVAPDKRNSTEILFDPEKLPSASIQEVVSPYLNRTFPTGNENVVFNTGQVKYQLLQGKPTLLLEGAQFSSSMVDGTLTVTAPNNPQPSPQEGTVNNATYTTTVKKVLNTNNVLLASPYTVDLNNSSVKQHTYNSFDASSYTLSYKDTPTFVATQNSMSYAQITLNDIEPATGDVYRVKTFRKSPGVVSTWQLVDDNILESSEMLVDNTALNINKRTGLFEDASIVNNYWNIDNTDNSISPVPSRSFVTTPLNNSLKVNTTEIPDNETIRLVSTQSLDFYEKGDYVLQFDAYTEQTGSTSKVNIYLSGSAFNYDGTKKISGKKIGFLNPQSETTRYDDYQIQFEADSDGKGTVIFEIEKGTWYFSEISLKSGEETGFNPNSTTIVVPIETQMLNDKLNFKFEYFDYENNQASHVTYLSDQSFVGGNTYIDGANNLLTGSMYIGRAFGRGLEQSGRSSGIIRSTGYLGFTSASNGTGPAGFMMWSGSALKDTAPGEYDGVGLDLHGGQATFGNTGTSPGVLQFRTDDRQLFVKGEIRTRFDDGRTMNPPQNLPKRFILSDQTNTFRFFETGSILETPIVEVGSPFINTDMKSTNEFTQSGMVIVQPSEYEGHPDVAGNNLAGLILQTEHTGSGETRAQLTITPAISKHYIQNHTEGGSLAFDYKQVNYTGSTTSNVSTLQWMEISGSNTSAGRTGVHLDIKNGASQAKGIYFQDVSSRNSDVYGIHIQDIAAHNDGGGGGQTAYGIRIQNISTGANKFSFHAAAGEMLNLATNSNTTANAANMYIDSNGLFYRSTSDRRIKKGIHTIDNALDKTLQLTGRYFFETGDINNNNRIIGLIAQEVQEVVPELIPERNNHESQLKSVAYGQVSALLIEAIKEQQQIIEDLQSRIERLEGKI